MDGRIILEEDGETVSIKDIQIQDENLYQFLKEADEDRRFERLVGAIRIGIVGLKRMAVGEELDYVEHGLDIIGNDYFVFGTMDRKDWKDTRTGKISQQDGIKRIYVFKDVWTFEVRPTGRYYKKR